MVAHNGCLHLEVRIEGRSAHAAMPETGVDALEATTKLLTSLYGLRETYKQTRSKIAGIDHPTLVVGLISGGINTNVVPDAVTLRLDRRIIPEESPETVERELVAHIEQVCSSLGDIKVSIRRILLARPFTPQAGQEQLVSIIQRHAREVIGEDIRQTASLLYTDACLYSGAGIPTVLMARGRTRCSRRMDIERTRNSNSATS